MTNPLRRRATIITPLALAVSALTLLLAPAHAEAPASAIPQQIPVASVEAPVDNGIAAQPESRLIVSVPTPEPAPAPTPAPQPEPVAEVEAPKPVEKKTVPTQERGKTPFSEGDMQKAEEKEAPVVTETPTQEQSPSAPAPRTSPGSNQDKARIQVAAKGWNGDQFSCLDKLWTKESSWNHLAQNPSSGAYGIPQSLPASKMATHGSDYRTNPDTQIAWGLDYISERYGTPCSAWSHSQQKNWY